RSLDCKIRIALQRVHRVWGQYIDRDVTTALAQFQGLGRFVWHDGKTNAGELRFFSPIDVVAFKYNFTVGFGADKFERPGADGMLGHLIGGSIGNNAQRAIGEVPEQWRIRLFQTENDGVVVWRFDMIDKFVVARLGATNFRL